MLFLLVFVLAGCSDPFTFGQKIVSLPWGAIMPAPAGSSVVYDRTSIYLLSKKRDWSLVLSVWRSGAPLGKVASRKLLDRARALAHRLPARRWLDGRSAVIGGASGLRFDFEGPAGEGQGAVHFRRSENVFHRVAVLHQSGRVYRLHFRSLKSAARFTTAIWTNVAGGIKFAGERQIIDFGSGGKLSEGEPGSLVESVLRGGNDLN